MILIPNRTCLIARCTLEPVAMPFDEKTRAELKNLFEKIIPIHRHLGLEFLEVEEGHVKVRMPFRDEFVGDFRQDRWHGGMMALLMDVAGGSAAMTKLNSWTDPIATVDIRVDYLRPATNHDVIAEGDVVRNGSAIIVTEMTAIEADSNILLSRGTGVFNVKRPES
jgi:uncharacterized protein (TIGR00369 family)